jgi:hypothetical protein
MNSFAPIPSNLIDVTLPPSGYIDDGGNTIDVLREVCGNASRAFPQALWIERKDWADKARENDKNNTWGCNFLDRFTNQDPTHECTCHSLRANAEAARNRQRGIIYADGPKKDFRYEESANGSVWLSPLSVYAEANPRQWGGANVRQVLEIACRRGMLPETIQPRSYAFKHAMQGTTGRGNNNQSRGPWLPLSRFPDGWPETAAHFKPEEVVFPESFEQAMCLLLHSIVVSVGRDGHAVPWDHAKFTGDDLSHVGYSDSYNIVRYDSVRRAQNAWRGSFAIVSMTTPDDWSDPAKG